MEEKKVIAMWAYKYSHLSGAVILAMDVLDRMPEKSPEEMASKATALKLFLKRVLTEGEQSTSETGRIA